MVVSAITLSLDMSAVVDATFNNQVIVGTMVS